MGSRTRTVVHGVEDAGRRYRGWVIGLLALGGCGSIYSNPYPPIAPPPAPSASAASSPASSSDPDPKQHAASILDRAKALREIAENAIQLDGTSGAAKARQALQTCHADRRTCQSNEQGLEPLTKTGALAGYADYLTEPLAGFIFSRAHGASLPLDLRPILAAEDDVALAETMAKQAMDAAQQVADRHAEEQRKLAAENEATSAAQDACARDQPACKAKCDAGKEGNYCFAWAVRLRTGTTPKLADARVYFQKACDAGTVSGCAALPGIDQQLQAGAANAETFWASLAEIADDLTQKEYAAQKLAQVANSPSRVRALETLRSVNQAAVREQLCPAKKAFLQVSSAADLQQRATAHCKDHAPTGQGLSGAWVPLNAQCSQVFASPCP